MTVYTMMLMPWKLSFQKVETEVYFRDYLLRFDYEQLILHCVVEMRRTERSFVP